jgi:DNA-binding IclR family transcriptional regulator
MLDSGFMRLGANLNSRSRGKGANTSAYIVPAVDRAVRILSLVRKEGRGLTLADVTEATGWHKSSVHKLLVTLNHHGLLDRDALTKRFCLGVALAEYGRAALNNLDIRQSAKPFLKALVNYSGETAVLSVLRDTQMVLVDIEEPQTELRVSLSVGLRSPATTTSNGKAVLAWLPENQVNEIMRIEGLPALTKKSITRRRIYLAELGTTRKRGYATDCEEYLNGVSGVSAPVFNTRKQVIASISLVGPAFRMTKSRIRHYGKRCVEMATQLSATLG